MGVVRELPARKSADAFERGLGIFLVFSFASGALAHLLPAVLPITRYITDLLLIVTNGLILYAVYLRNGDARLFVWAFCAYWFTFAAEALGVATGAIFGEYAYGPTMWMQWLGVPFAIAFNWVVLTLAANELTARVIKSPWPAAVLAGAVLALYDIAIEPVAIELDYWRWSAGDIPLQNYLAWAVVGALISLPLRLLGIRFRSSVLPIYFWAQLAFFIILAAFL